MFCYAFSLWCPQQKWELTFSAPPGDLWQCDQPEREVLGGPSHVYKAEPMGFALQLARVV